MLVSLTQEHVANKTKQTTQIVQVFQTEHLFISQTDKHPGVSEALLGEIYTGEQGMVTSHGQ